MSIRPLLAGACAVAGVGMLAGPGWALLLAAVLLYLTPPPARLHAVVSSARSAVGRTARWLATGRRQTKAAAAMPLAIIGLTVGVSLAIGVGWGLTAASVAVGGLSLAADKAE